MCWLAFLPLVKNKIREEKEEEKKNRWLNLFIYWIVWFNEKRKMCTSQFRHGSGWWSANVPPIKRRRRKKKVKCMKESKDLKNRIKEFHKQNIKK